MAWRLKSEAQQILDVMFEVLSIVHEGGGPRRREDCMEWARDQLKKCGISVHPMGSSHGVIEQPLLCPDDPDWDWWLNLPPQHRSAMVKHYRELLKECGHGR